MLRRFGRGAGIGVAGALMGGAVWVTVDPGMRREFVFWKTAVPVVVRYKYTEWKYSGDEEQQKAQYERLHLLYAPVLLDLFSRLGGLFIKLGQVLSARPEIVPQAYRDQFRKLQSHVAGQPFSVIKDVVERELGGSLQSKYAFFSETPLGAASIGQAHKATTFDGEEVVVKVQYPDVSWQFHADLRSVELFTRLFFSYAMPLMEELKRQALEELDYVQEGKNIMDVYHGLMPVFAKQVAVPRLLEPLSSSRVLTMTFLEGPKLEEEALRQLKMVGVSFEEGLREKIASVGGAENLSFLASPSAASNATTTTTTSSSNAVTTTTSPVNVPASISLSNVLHNPSSFWMYAASFAPVRYLGLHGYLYYTRITLWLRSRELSSLLWLAEKSLWFGVGGEGLKNWVEKNRAEARRLRSLQHTKEWIDTLLAVHGFEVFKMQPSLFNADPHPGNILMMPDGRLGLIDYGQCRRVPEPSRRSLAELMVAVADAEDDATIANAMRAIGCRTKRNNDRFIATCGRLLFDRIDPKTMEVKFFWELHHLDADPLFPPDLLLVGRAAALLRGTAFALGHNVSIASHWKPLALDLLTPAGESSR